MLKVYLRGDELIKTDKPFYVKERTRGGPHRRPLRGLERYSIYVSSSGLMGGRTCEGTCLSLNLGSVNMAFKAHLIRDFPLSLVMRGSRKAFWFEQILVYYVITKGAEVYELGERSSAPIVWHVAHEDSLTRGRGFWHEFWVHYDRVAAFWRLRRLGAPYRFRGTY